jgi:hypothetical protein
MSGYAERPARAVPRAVRLLLPALLIGHVVFAALQPRPTARAEELPIPASLPVLRILSGGDPIPLAQTLTLHLQAFDNQPGISIPFAQLDYGRVLAWLERILELDTRTQYPLLMASQLYAQVPDEAKQRQMLAFVYRQFLNDPNRRWPWLAHAAILVKHRLHDLPLALEYAQAIAEHATSSDVPHWAQQMHIFLHEDLGEYETARLLLGGLLASDTVKDPHELHLLMDRLRTLTPAEKSSSAPERRRP